MLSIQKTIKSVRNEDILFSPKLIVSFVAIGAEEDCDVLKYV
jgi:hypothetical protein